MRFSADWMTSGWSAGIAAALTWGNGIGGWWWLGIGMVGMTRDGCVCGDAGFQLTRLITLGLLIAAEPVSQWFPLPWKEGDQMLAVTMIAHLLSFLVVISFFYTFSTGPWWVDLWVVPIVGVCFP